MLEVSEAAVAAWGRRIGIGDARLAEIDFRLVHLIRAISEDEILRSRLGFKGGTPLNKLYLGTRSRLSVDLDYNALGTRDEVQRDRGLLQERILDVLRDHDPNMTLSRDHSWEMLRVTGKYLPQSGGAPQPIKVEVSMVERFPITRLVARPLAMPDRTEASIPTYSIDELVATKVRALYQRRKGRDGYDLAQARDLVEDPALVRKMAIYYFYRSRGVYDPQDLRKNMEAKARDNRFLRDLPLYLRGGAGFDLAAAMASLPQAYEFLFEVDEKDLEFISFAEAALSNAKSEAADGVRANPHPLHRLLGDRPGASDDAKRATHEDIKVFADHER